MHDKSTMGKNNFFLCFFGKKEMDIEIMKIHMDFAILVSS